MKEPSIGRRLEVCRLGTPKCVGRRINWLASREVSMQTKVSRSRAHHTCKAWGKHPHQFVPDFRNPSCHEALRLISFSHKLRHGWCYNKLEEMLRHPRLCVKQYIVLTGTSHSRNHGEVCMAVKDREWEPRNILGKNRREIWSPERSLSQIDDFRANEYNYLSNTSHNYL